MLFFQMTLFGGYVYAHFLTQQENRHKQAIIHILLLIISTALALLVIPDLSLRPTDDENPNIKILTVLSLSVGIPYFCLATTGPLLQYWFTQTKSNLSTYRLFSLSNFGSFIALLSFPYFFEPNFSLETIGHFWTYGFWFFSILCIAVTLYAWSIQPNSQLGTHIDSDRNNSVVVNSQDKPTFIQRVSWVGLPALASLAFIATTDQVSHDIAPEPRLWIATLSLYLLTFIICFDHSRWYKRAWIPIICIAFVILLEGRLEIPRIFGYEVDYGMSETQLMYLGTMFLICLICHGELYRARPTQPKYLTEFYICLSLGGACGGLFVSLIATNYFNDYYEWPILIVVSLALSFKVIEQEWNKKNKKEILKIFIIIFIFIAAIVTYFIDKLHYQPDIDPKYQTKLLHQSRNFYGTVTARERDFPDSSKDNSRIFYSGQITHGIQYLEPARRRLPIAYYSETSGIGESIRYLQSRQESLSVAIIGLGAGTLANYARHTDTYDFYEINPDAIQVANQWFDNIKNCSAKHKDIILGDARLNLEKSSVDKKYDLIVLDAFTGGSIPIHLLTKEAFEIYANHLTNRGIIAINITNGYLNLYPVVKKQAEQLQLGYRNKFQNKNSEKLIRQNHWFMMTSDNKYLSNFHSENRKYFDASGNLIRIDDPNVPNISLWSDSFSSISSIEIKD